MIFPFSSDKIILSASPSKDIPISALYFLTKNFIFLGKVEPQFSLMLKPLGDVPNWKTFAPKLLKSFGPDL